MLCERCKIREVSIQYTEVINGVKIEHHFCVQCAREMDFGAYSTIFDEEFPLAKLLFGLLGAEAPTECQDKRQKIVYLTCSSSYREFVKSSCFGCVDYYGASDVLTNENTKQPQGSDCHKGKRPVYQRGSASEDKVEETAGVHSSVEEKMRSLGIRLRDAIRPEEYEIAAQCCDRIRELEQTADTHENMEKGEETDT